MVESACTREQTLASDIEDEIEPSMDSKQYRFDIDGLRAIAVLAVLINHLNPQYLPGGFVGVDVFFVISGYLITSQIIKDIDQKRFSFLEFYKRRINRIVPALVVVLLTTLFAGAVLLSPADLVGLSKASFYALIGASNIFLWQEYGNYFAGEAAESPLLHTWSLGVEEQFYVVWPVLLLLLRSMRRHIVLVLAVTTLGALAFSQYATGVAASAAYYLLPTRFFELMIGGLIAFIVLRATPRTKVISQLASVTGILFIAGSLVFINKTTAFPGISAFWPCLGAALVIWGGSNQHVPFWVLRNRVMRFLGLISYSLYLWHWPLIAYLNYLDVEVTVPVALSVFVCSILVAWISWRFVEVPFRKTGISLSAKQVLSRRFLVPLAALAVITGTTVVARGLPQRFDERVAGFEEALKARPEMLRKGCHVPTALYVTPIDNKCKLGVDKEPIDGILIGDSFANHFSGMIDVLAKAQNLTITDYTMDGCPPIMGYDTGKARSYADKCIARNNAIYARLKAKPYSRVLLAGNWPNDPQAGVKLMSSIDQISSTGAEITLILKNQEIENAQSCSVRKLMYGLEKDCSVPLKRENDYLTAVIARYPEIHVVDPNAAICRVGKCSPLLDNVLLYRDAAHLNDIGSRLIGKYLRDANVKL
jgi:peptidoglycan/LPS O-acetylase OafA/YrhL